MQWKKWLAAYMYFTRSERRNLLYLSIVLILLLIAPKFISRNTDSEPELRLMDIPKTMPIVDTFLPPNSFDPNTVSAEVLLSWGIPKKAVENLIKYRESGGKFKEKKDVKKIYGLPEIWFDSIADYIKITPIKKKETRSFSNKRKWDLTPIDINSATIEEWQKLYGIGPVLSKRIVAFRDKLGGFYSVEQIAETWGLADSTFQNIKGRLKYTTQHKPLQINSLPIDSIAAHPYISWKQAKVVVRYRSNHGPYLKAEDLLETVLIDSSTLQRLMPYLNFE